MYSLKFNSVVSDTAPDQVSSSREETDSDGKILLYSQWFQFWLKASFVLRMLIINTEIICMCSNVLCAENHSYRM